LPNESLGCRSVSYFRIAGMKQIRDTMVMETSEIFNKFTLTVKEGTRFGDLDDQWFSRMKSQRSSEDSVKDDASKVWVRSMN
jgi:hypothetical protein